MPNEESEKVYQVVRYIHSLIQRDSSDAETEFF